MTQTVKVTVNPAEINKFDVDDIQIMNALNSFLNGDKSGGLWVSNQHYEYTYQEIKYQFNFTQSILKRTRKAGREGMRFEIFNPNDIPLGKGGYGIVYPIVGTIKFNTGKAIVKTGSKKVVKIQDHSKKDKTTQVKQEYKGLLQSEHLHPKPPVFIEQSGDKKSFLVMDLADGIPLEKILHPKKRNEISGIIPELTVAKRLELTIAILNAIKVQVTDKGLIHRDIKPGNLIIDWRESPPKVTVVDYGFCIERGQQDYQKVGTRAYRPHESFLTYPVYTVKSDVYSAGRILSYLWGDDYQNYYFSRDKDWSYIKNKSTNEHLFNGLDNINDLSSDVQNKIRTHLNKMLQANPNIRPPIDESIKHFIQIDAQLHPKMVLQSPSQTSITRLEIRIIQHIEFVRDKLIILQVKETNLRERGYDAAADTMSKLIKEIKEQTHILERKPELSTLKNYQNMCLTEIKSSKQVLQKHRDSWWLVAEILTAISLLGVGYLIALGVNYLTTNRIGLFSQTKSDQLVENIEESILAFMPSVQ